MTSNKDRINKIPILEVLAKLGYHKGTHYILQGKNIRMKDSAGKISDGWIGDIVKNKMFAKSGLKEGRFEGDILGIIKGALNIEVSEAFKWAENAFDIENNISEPKRNKIQEKWNEMDSLSEKQIDYLKTRSIEFNDHIKKVTRNNNGAISIKIQSEGENIKAIQSRKIDENVDKKFRYQIEKDGEDGTGIFHYFPNQDKKVCFVVEGMTDFLTMVQFGVNVIGLVSATTGINYLKAFQKKYNLIYIPDNDDGGISSIETLDNNEIIYGKYLLEGEYGDINDFWSFFQSFGLDSSDFLNEIYEESERPLDNLGMAINKAKRNSEVGSYLVGDKVFDNATGGITPGSVMIINGLSGEGKTTTLDWVVTSLMKHEKKMAFCSIDDDVGKMLAMFLGRHFQKDWRSEISPNIEEYVKQYGRDKIANHLYMSDSINTLKDFEDIVALENVDVLIIDYIQVIEGLSGKDMQSKMLEAIRGLQRLSIDTHTAIICLSQVAKGEDQKPVLYRTPMESQYIKSASDTFINVGVYQGKHKIAFVKNKYGMSEYKNTEHDTHWDKASGKISIFEDFRTSDKDDSRKI